MTAQEESPKDANKDGTLPSLFVSATYNSNTGAYVPPQPKLRPRDPRPRMRPIRRTEIESLRIDPPSSFAEQQPVPFDAQPRQGVEVWQPLEITGDEPGTPPPAQERAR